MKLIDVEKWKQTSISALKEVNFNLLSLTRSVICDYHTKVEEILVKIICKSHGNEDTRHEFCNILKKKR